MDDDEVARLLPGVARSAFTVRRHVLAPGATEAHDEARWQDAIVIVERGELELGCSRGRRHTVREGSILWLAGLPVRTLRNPGVRPVVLVAVSRRSIGSAFHS